MDFAIFLLDRKHHPISSGSILITKPTTVESSTIKQFLFLGVYEGELLRSVWATDTGSFFFPTGLVNDIVSNGKTWIH